MNQAAKATPHKTSQFDTFGLSEPLLAAIRRMGFENPTPIQAQAIPLALEGRDVLGCAGTGTGKTAAFGIPLVHDLLRDPKQSALIIAPTRELATQIAKVIDTLTQASMRSNLRVALLIGGESMERQKRALRGHPRIVVGTPGRINDHLDAGRFQPRFFNTLVLDEADRMLDMGFEPQLREIVSGLPKKRRTHLFSATLPAPIRKLAASYQVNPAFIDVRVKPSDDPKMSAITQTVTPMDPGEKKERLLDELNEREGTAIVFVGTKRRTDQIAHFLSGYGHSVGLIHGGRSQSQRNRAIRDFRVGKTRILVATDVAARGIDVPHVAHVINFDLPQSPEDYIHRIGRTGRAGATGHATCFVSRSDFGMWRDIVKLGIGAPPLKPSEHMKHRGPSRPTPARPSQKPKITFRGSPAHSPSPSAGGEVPRKAGGRVRRGRNPGPTGTGHHSAAGPAKARRRS